MLQVCSCIASHVWHQRAIVNAFSCESAIDLLGVNVFIWHSNTHVHLQLWMPWVRHWWKVQWNVLSIVTCRIPRINGLLNVYCAFGDMPDCMPTSMFCASRLFCGLGTNAGVHWCRAEGWHHLANNNHANMCMICYCLWPYSSITTTLLDNMMLGQCTCWI